MAVGAAVWTLAAISVAGAGYQAHKSKMQEKRAEGQEKAAKKEA
jgi:hypothetical protein